MSAKAKVAWPVDASLVWPASGAHRPQGPAEVIACRGTVALDARPAVTQVSRDERGVECACSIGHGGKMEKVCLCGFERDAASETRQKHCLLQLAGPNETEARMRRKASETDVDHKVMDGVTSNRGQESRGSHLNGSDSEHPYARDARKARHVGRPSWCNVVHSVAQETEDEDARQTRARERKREKERERDISP